MSLFKCKVCVEKEKRIADLKDEIRTLRRAFMSTARDTSTMEANAILSAENMVLNIPTDDAEEAANVENEAASLLTAGY